MKGSMNQYATPATGVMEAAESIASALGAESAAPVLDPSEALRAVLFNLGLGPECEVLVPAFGKHTPGPEVCGVGARPSYVDVGKDIVLNRDNLTRKLEAEYRRENGKWVHRRRGLTLRGIVMTHPFGFAPFLDEVEEFAEEHGLILVDDARGALGSQVWSNSRSAWISAGAGGVAGVASFNGSAFVISSDPELVRIVSAKLRDPREEGLSSEALRDLRISAMRTRRRLREALVSEGLGAVPETPNYCQTACHEVILVAKGERDEAAERLKEAGFIVETDFWPWTVMNSPDRQYGYRKGRCPESEELSRKAIAVRMR